jgi:hypothetical protein
MILLERRKLLGPVLALALLGGCSGENVSTTVPQPERVRDLNSEVYGWECDEYGYRCRGTFIDESPPPPTCSDDWHPSVVWTAGSMRFFPLYVTCASDESGTWLIDASESRYLVCESDADCPNLVYSNVEYRFECESGLCQNIDTTAFPRDELSPGEVAGLCRAGTPRQSSFEIDQDEYDAFWALIEQYCPEAGPDCEVPPECQKP